MLNIFAKCLLVSTSLSPVLIAVAINQFERGEPCTSWIWWLVAAFVLVLLCWALLRYAGRKVQECLLFIKEFERKDQEVLTFLFIYLLPFLRSEQSIFATGWLTSGYILAIIILAIAYAGAFHFNPVMRILFRYRFYAIKNDHGISNLLISKTDLQQSGQKIKTVRLARNVHLHTGNTHA